MIKSGDLLLVVSSNDTLVKEGSYGLVEKTQGYGDEPDYVVAIFNFMPPWKYKSKIFDASGGPEFQIAKSKIVEGKEKKTIKAHIQKEGAILTTALGGSMYGWTELENVQVTVHKVYLK